MIRKVSCSEAYFQVAGCLFRCVCVWMLFVVLVGFAFLTASLLDIYLLSQLEIS